MRPRRHGHGVVRRAFVADQFHEQGFGGIAGNDDGAVHASAKEAGAGGDAEVAAMIHAAVAAITVGFEDGLDALRVEGEGAGVGSGLRCDGLLPEGGGGGEGESGGGECDGEAKADHASGLRAAINVSRGCGNSKVGAW